MSRRKLVDPLADIRNEFISYRGFKATRTEAYEHALKHTGDHMCAERMAYGFGIPVLTPEQIERYLPLSYHA